MALRFGTRSFPFLGLLPLGTGLGILSLCWNDPLTLNTQRRLPLIHGPSGKKEVETQSTIGVMLLSPRMWKNGSLVTVREKH